MRVFVKVFATLVRLVPGARAGVPFERSLPAGASVADLIEHLGLPRGDVRLVFVNGLAKEIDQTLAADDEIGLFPPIGGGSSR